MKKSHTIVSKFYSEESLNNFLKYIGDRLVSVNPLVRRDLIVYVVIYKALIK